MHQVFIKKIEKSIEYGLYLFTFLLPWQTRLILAEGNLNGVWEYGTISIYATEILLWVIFTLTAVWWFAKKSEIRNPKSETNPKSKILNSKFVYLFICLSAYLLYSLVSILWSDSRIVALQTWAHLAGGVGLFLVLRAAKFDVIKLVWAFVISAVIQAGLGVWQFLSQSTFSSKWLGMAMHDPTVPGTFVVETELRRWLRAYGSLPHPNMLAGFLATAMFLIAWLYQKTEYGFKKIFLPVIFIILSFGLFTTFSKSVIGGFLVALFFLWAMIFLRKWSSISSGNNGSTGLTTGLFPKRVERVEGQKEIKIIFFKFTLIFIAVATIFSVVFWEPVQTRIYGAERLEIKSTTERLDYFNQAWQLIKNHPFIGVGLGNYTLAVHNEINPNLQSWDYQPVHNIYLLILAELGIIGLILWLAVVFFIVKKLPITHYPLLLTFLVIGLFDHYLWTLYFGIILFWLVLGTKRKILTDPLTGRKI
jgi:O-antigen ligase